MGKAGEPKILPSKDEDYTAITFYPDLSKFKMDSLDKDIVDLFTRRAYDVAASTPGVKVYLNGKRLPVKNFKDYIDLYIKNKTDDNGSPLKLVHEKVSDRWEIAVTLSEKGFQQVSFVNSIATTKGGRHVDYIGDQVVNKMIEVVKKKEKKGSGVSIKPFQVRSHVWVFINCLIENPTFDSQTKENMSSQIKNFGSKCQLPEKFIERASKCGIVESVQMWMKFKAQEKLNKKCHGSKHSKLKGIPKLDDANDAGTKNSHSCTLILTEGDSAKTLAVAGLSVIGRDRYGVFPLKGKVLNVREATHKQIMENAEINNLIKIVGLQYKEKYADPETLKKLRYGKIMIMTDQDQDGSHIKGLLINFIHHNWPQLLKHNFLEEFITPIVKVSKKKEEKSFYSLPEFEEWKQETPNWHTYKIKYYKGLGTSTSKEAKEYFSDMQRHRIPFRYGGVDDDAAIELAFSKKKIDDRKEWLTNWMEERKRRAQLGLPELFLYGKETKHVTFNEFVNRELILFSNMDNERSIPSLVDGFKPGQRKVMYTCFKRNLIKELKVAQLAGSVAETSAYHHGETSLMSTIIGLAQNFVGSNNLNVLQPIGQFGTRLHGGKDAASPRYIFTALSTLARCVFHTHDEPLLNSLFDDNQKIEPEYYMPIVPMVLVNGSEGIGTGWSTKIPNYDIREIINNLKRMMEGMEPLEMLPSFKDFKGTIERLDESRFVVNGEVSIVDDTTIEITELPLRTWTQAYKESVLEPMLQGTDKSPAMITDYKEYHTDCTVKFVVKMTQEKLARAEDAGLHKVFKLQTTISTGTMVLFDSNGCVKKYTQVEEILREFFELRLDYYRRRKDYLEGMLAAESLKLDNIARFIMEKIEGKITIENVKKKDIIQMLVRRGYDPDPVKSWKQAQDKLQSLEDSDNEDDDESVASSAAGGGPDFNYILSMPLWNLTKEKKDELIKQRDAKAEELYQLRKKEPNDLWRDDLTQLLEELEKVEKEEKEEQNTERSITVKTAKGRAKSKKLIAVEETMPSPVGRRVEPRVDSALKLKAVKAAAARSKKLLKREAMLAQDLLGDFDDEDTEMKSLADRIGSPTAEGGEAKAEAKPETKPGKTKAAAGEGKVKKPRKPREPKEPKSPKAPKGSPRGKGKGAKGKGGKKRNPWSDSESDDVISDVSDMSDLDGSYSAKPVIPRDTAVPRRAAATKAKYTFSEDEEEKFSSDDDDAPKRKPAAPPVNISASPSPTRSESPTSRVFGSQNTDDIFGSTNSKPSPPRSKSPALVDSDMDDDPIFPPPAASKPAPAKKTLGKKTVPTAAAKKAKAADPKQPNIFDAISKVSKTKPAAKPIAVSSGSDSEMEIGSSVPSLPPSQATGNGAVKDSDSDSDFDLLIEEEKPKPKATAKRPKQVISDDSNDDDFAPKKKKVKPKKVKENDDLFGEPKPKKPRAPKKKKPKVSDDDDSDSYMPTTKKSTAAKKKKKAISDDDDDEFNMEDIAPRARGGGRSRAPVKYNFGEDDDEDDDY